MCLCVWMLYEEKGFPWGELSPVGRLRGVGVMYMSYFAVTPLCHRCAMTPAPRRGFIVLLSNILKAAFS